MDLATLGLKVDGDGALLVIKSIDDRLAALGRTSSTVKGILATLGVTFTAGMVLRKFIQETSEAQYQEAQLAAALKSTGGAAGQTMAALKHLAEQMEQTTVYSNHVVMGAEAMLVSFNNIKGSIFTDALQAAANMAARFGGDLPSAAHQLGIALQDPEKASRTLRSSIGNLSDAELKLIKSMIDAGNIAGAQRLILNKLETALGGAASAARNTLGGALQGLKNSFNELFNITGTQTNALIPIINTLSEAFHGLKGIFGDFLMNGALLLVNFATNVRLADAAMLRFAAHLLDVYAQIKTVQAGIAAALGMTGAAGKTLVDAQALRDKADAWRKVADGWKKDAENFNTFMATMLGTGPTTPPRGTGGGGSNNNAAVDDSIKKFKELRAERELDLKNLTEMNAAIGATDLELAHLSVTQDAATEKLKNAVDHTKAQTAELNRLTDAMEAQQHIALEIANQRQIDQKLDTAGLDLADQVNEAIARHIDAVNNDTRAMKAWAVTHAGDLAVRALDHSATQADITTARVLAESRERSRQAMEDDTKAIQFHRSIAEAAGDAELELAIQTTENAVKEAEARGQDTTALKEQLVSLAVAVAYRNAENAATAKGVTLTDEETLAIGNNAAARERARQAGEKNTKATKEMGEQQKKLIQDMKQALAGFFEDAFSKGMNAFQSLFDAIKEMFFKMIADIIASQYAKKLADWIGSKILTPAVSGAGAEGGAGGAATAGLSTGGLVAGGLIAGMFAIGTSIMDTSKKNAEAAKTFAAASKEWNKSFKSLIETLEGNDFTRAQASLRDQFQSLVDEIINAAATAIKNSPAARFGASGVGLFGSTIGTVPGAADIAALDQYIAWLKGAQGTGKNVAQDRYLATLLADLEKLNAKYKEQAEALRILHEEQEREFNADLDARMLRAKGDEDAAAALELWNTQVKEFATATKTAGWTPETLARLSDTQAAERARLAEDQAEAARRKIEDANLRGRGTGFDVSDAQAIVDAEREIWELRRAGASDELLAAIADAQDREAKERAQTRIETNAQAVADAHVRQLRAQGATWEAEQAERAEAQRRELAAAEAQGLDALTLAAIKAAQAAETAQDAWQHAQSVIDQNSSWIEETASVMGWTPEKTLAQEAANWGFGGMTPEQIKALYTPYLSGGAELTPDQKEMNSHIVAWLDAYNNLQQQGSGTGASANTGAMSAQTAVSATVTERTAYILVDISRQQLTVLRSIDGGIRRITGGGLVPVTNAGLSVQQTNSWIEDGNVNRN